MDRHPPLSAAERERSRSGYLFYGQRGELAAVIRLDAPESFVPTPGFPGQVRLQREDGTAITVGYVEHNPRRSEGTCTVEHVERAGTDPHGIWALGTRSRRPPEPATTTTACFSLGSPWPVAGVSALAEIRCDVLATVVLEPDDAERLLGVCRSLQLVKTPTDVPRC